MPRFYGALEAKIRGLAHDAKRAIGAAMGDVA